MSFPGIIAYFIIFYQDYPFSGLRAATQFQDARYLVVVVSDLLINSYFCAIGSVIFSRAFLKDEAENGLSAP